MRSLVAACSIALLSCAAGPGIGALRPSARPLSRNPDIALRFLLAQDESIVYRRLGEPDGGASWPELHWVERGDDGTVVLGVNDPALHDAGLDEMPADLVFPLMDAPPGPGPVRRRRTVTVGELQLTVEEELRTADTEAGAVLVRFRRRTTALTDGPTQPAALTEQRGEATYDPAAGRFTRIELMESRDAAFGGGSGTAVWAYDEPLSRERTEARRAARAMTSSPPDPGPEAATEIGEILEALARSGSSPRLAFYLHARPQALWAGAFDRPAVGASFVALERVRADFRRGPSDEVLALLRSRWAEAAFAYPLVAETADERLRPELRRLAAGRGAIATEARLTLQALDLLAQPRVDRWGPLVSYPARFRAIWQRLSSAGVDPSPLVPVLFALASRPNAPALVGDVCLEAVRLAGFPERVDDRRLWRQWWAREGTAPWAERLVGAARSRARDQRADAINALSRVPESSAATEALSAALEDEVPAVRLAAAKGLARSGDPSGAPVLVEALRDPALSEDALEALGYLAQSTLGLDPSAAADDPNRIAALARWRQWLRRSSNP